MDEVNEKLAKIFDQWDEYYDYQGELRKDAPLYSTNPFLTFVLLEQMRGWNLHISFDSTGTKENPGYFVRFAKSDTIYEATE